MTLAVTGPIPQRSEFRRWGGSLFLVLLLHAGAGIYLASRQVVSDVGGAPPEAIMIDLAPLPVPPQPVPPQPVVQPPQPLPQVEPVPPPAPFELPKLEPSPAPKPAVVLPQKPKPRPVPQPPRAEPQPQLQPQQPVAAPAAPARPAPTVAPPAANPAARATWQQQLAGWLERYKRYPRLAQEQRQEGTAYLRFTMDRQGHVLSSRIDKGSGYTLLDEEVLALVQRAQPLPAPPAEVPGAQIELTVPIQFILRNGMR